MPLNPKKPLGEFLPVGNYQCVDFVKAHGFSHLRGNAHVWIQYVNSDIPTIGGVVILNESKLGHLALILNYDEQLIYIVEQNYLGLGIVSYRQIERDYSKINGYIY